jgi:predicted kinase
LTQSDQPTLIIFSGLPGTGKSTLSDRLAREMQWPLLRIDDVAGNIPADVDYHFWDEKILVLLTIAEEQLKLGVSVIADSVFMGTDRLHAQEIASKHGAAFRPVYCYMSDEKLWEQRVTKRSESVQSPNVATWEQIQHQRQWFAPWQTGTALFIDAVEPVEQNYTKVFEFVVNPTVSLEPLEVDVPVVKGQYHNK